MRVITVLSDRTKCMWAMAMILLEGLLLYSRMHVDFYIIIANLRNTIDSESISQKKRATCLLSDYSSLHDEEQSILMKTNKSFSIIYISKWLSHFMNLCFLRLSQLLGCLIDLHAKEVQMKMTQAFYCSHLSKSFPLEGQTSVRHKTWTSWSLNYV